MIDYGYDWDWPHPHHGMETFCALCHLSPEHFIHRKPWKRIRPATTWTSDPSVRWAFQVQRHFTAKAGSSDP